MVRVLALVLLVCLALPSHPAVLNIPRGPWHRTIGAASHRASAPEVESEQTTMNRLWVWLLAGIACTVGATVRADGLAGVWRFQKEINTTLSGEAVEIPGAAYEGMLTADGYVSANIMPKGRSWRVDGATLKELRQSVGEGSSTAYAGRYEVDVAAGTLTHIPFVGLDPADEGRRLVRHYGLEGDTLKPSGKWTYEGRELVFTVIWARVD